MMRGSASIRELNVFIGAQYTLSVCFGSMYSLIIDETTKTNNTTDHAIYTLHVLYIDAYVLEVGGEQAKGYGVCEEDPPRSTYRQVDTHL